MPPQQMAEATLQEEARITAALKDVARRAVGGQFKSKRDWLIALSAAVNSPITAELWSE